MVRTWVSASLLEQSVLHDSASDSAAVLRDLPLGSIVWMLPAKRQDKWIEVIHTLDETRGFIRTVTSPYVIQKWTTLSRDVAVHSEPDSKSAVLSTLRHGSTLLNVGPVRRHEGIDWMPVLVRPTGEAGFVLGKTRITNDGPQQRSEKIEHTHTIRVTLADNSIEDYAGKVRINQLLVGDVVSGRVPSSAKAEEHVVRKSGESVRQGTIRELARNRFALECLYRPVRAHAIRGLGIGAVVGVALKLVDTNITLFRVDPVIVFAMLAPLGGIFIPKIGFYVMVGLILLSVQLGIGMNVYLTIIASALIGALLTAFPGMAIGGFIGAVRSMRSQRAPDAPREGLLVFLAATVLPAVLAAVVLWSYFAHFNPWISSWLNTE